MNNIKLELIKYINDGKNNIDKIDYLKDLNILNDMIINNNIDLKFLEYIKIKYKDDFDKISNLQLRLNSNNLNIINKSLYVEAIKVENSLIITGFIKYAEDKTKKEFKEKYQNSYDNLTIYEKIIYFLI